jgi:hypothetical protein
MITPTIAITTSRAAYEIVRASWIDLIRQHGWSEIYTRPKLETARTHWPDFTAGDDWVEAGIAEHRAHWADYDGCGRESCRLHDQITNT